MSEIKLYLDEDINPQLARDLRNRGYDAVSTNEAKNLGLSDQEQLDYARAHGRALLTITATIFWKLPPHSPLREPPTMGYSMSHRLPMAYSSNAFCRFWPGQVRLWPATSFFGFHDCLVGESIAKS